MPEFGDLGLTCGDMFCIRNYISSDFNADLLFFYLARTEEPYDRRVLEELTSFGFVTEHKWDDDDLDLVELVAIAKRDRS